MLRRYVCDPSNGYRPIQVRILGPKAIASVVIPNTTAVTREETFA